MSLGRALSTLSPDEYAERVLRDVLTLFGHHKREWLTEKDVQSRTGRTNLEIRGILPVLRDSFVLDWDCGEQAYRYNGDVALEYEIDAFMRRVDYHQSHVRSNLARFRERQGY